MRYLVVAASLVTAACSDSTDTDPPNFSDLTEPVGAPCSTTAVDGLVTFQQQADSRIVGSIATASLVGRRLGIALSLGLETVAFSIEGDSCIGEATGFSLGLRLEREELGTHVAPGDVSNSGLDPEQPTGTVALTGYNPAGPWLCGSFDLTFPSGRSVGTFQAVDHCGRLGH